MSRFDDLQKQGDDVYKALLMNGLNHEVSTWLADLHVRVRECEKALVLAGLAAEVPIKE
jgi:hypothetical protein